MSVSLSGRSCSPIVKAYQETAATSEAKPNYDRQVLLRLAAADGVYARGSSAKLMAVLNQSNDAEIIDGIKLWLETKASLHQKQLVARRLQC